MIDYHEAIRKVREAAKPLDSREIALDCALGYVLSRDLVSKFAQPPFDRSPFDGYAFYAGDTKPAGVGEGVELEIVGTIPAGETSVTALQRGQAVRIFTGAMVPAGADAVAAQENVSVRKNKLNVLREYRPGENIVKAGEDIKAGRMFLRRGCLLGPSELGVAASQGFTSLPVYRKPVVAILSSGSELAEVGNKLGPGQIYNSNRHTLEALVRLAGGTPVYQGRLPDELDRLATGITRAFASADIVLTTGGVSVGDHDLIPAAAAMAGTKLLFHRVAMKPGTPLLAALYGEKLFFGLSGNPAACLVAFLQFVLPALKIMSGLVNWQHQWVEAVTGKPLEKCGNQNRFLSARTVWREGRFVAELALKQKPGVLSTLCTANSLIFLPAGGGPFSAGQTIRVQLFPEIFGNNPLFQTCNYFQPLARII